MPARRILLRNFLSPMIAVATAATVTTDLMRLSPTTHPPLVGNPRWIVAKGTLSDSRECVCELVTQSTNNLTRGYSSRS
jgi:hypothetical protein